MTHARMPTQIGDVLILATTKFVNLVGWVLSDGQQDFVGQRGMTYASDLADALAEAKTLLVPGRRIFLRDLDSGTWSEISGQPGRGPH
jgi:hypothetical protein